MLTNLRFASRQLAKSPAFTFIAVLTLALGIGSAATVFTAVNAALLRPLPFIQHQERMLWLNEAMPAKGVDSTSINLADFYAWRERTKTLAALWVFQDKTAIINGRTEPVRRLAASITDNAFQAMGVNPLLGRNLRLEDDAFGAPAVAVLSYEMWQRDFGGAEDIVGQTAKINNEDTTIVGVMPRGWRYPEDHDLWLPMRATPDDRIHHGSYRYDGHAMLKPGVSLDEARAELATISAALAKEFPATNDGLVAVIRPVREEAVQDARDLLVLLFGAVMFVFLIACANVANLLLARGSVRTKEIAIRLALGATRRQLIAQLLTESLLLSVLGGVAGLVVALWGTDLIVAQLPDNHHPFWLNFGLDPRVFGFVTALSILASLVFGLAPAFQASRPEVMDEIKEGGRGTGGGVRAHRVRNALVIAEIALALVLLVGAGLMMRSFLTLNRADPGFDARGVFTFRLGFPTSVTEDPDVIRRFFADLVPRLSALPGADAAAGVSALPGVGNGGFNGILVEGEPYPASMADAKAAVYRVITPRYFEALRIPKKTGRFFTDHDDDSHPRVAVIDETFAKRHFPKVDPIGKRFCTLGKASEKPQWLEVVGVVGATRRFFDRDEPAGTFYTPHAQNPTNFMSVVIRVQGEPNNYVNAARNEVLAVNKAMPIYYEMSLAQAIERSDSVWTRAFFGRLFAAFAGVALLLASIGIYGVMAYSVAQRTQEIGVRMALGAQPRDVIGMVVRQGIRLVGAGLALGFVAAYLAAGVLANTLYGVSPHDPPTFALVPLLLAAVALLACYLPSRRATLIDPMIALRSE